MTINVFDSWLHKKNLTSYMGQLAMKLNLIDDIHVYYFKHLIRFKANHCN